MLITEAELKGVTELKTGIRLVFAIPIEKLTENEILVIKQMNSEAGWLTFTRDKLKTEIEAVMKDRKIGADYDKRSKSEQMRGILYEYWMAGNPAAKSFEDFYNEKMEGYIQKLKSIVGQIEADKLDEYYNQK
jgi:hypothetical protein